MECAIGMTDHLSSMCLLMGVESKSGAADAEATVTWPGAEVAVRLSPPPDCSFVFQSFDPRVLKPVDCLMTALQPFRLSDPTYHCSGLTSPRGTASCCTFRVSFYYKTGPYCRRFPTASCPKNTCFAMRLYGMHIM